jgi:ubiquinol-cytochrome c reductase cytochrome b subunit
MIPELLRWLEERTGIPGAVRAFFSEEIPASAGWAQAIGSVVLFLFFIQVFTGALLAFNYAPTPGEAYRSLNYILREVPGGRMVRGLHHWGSSLMIGAVVLHMIQVFLYGAYRKPREATWMVGVALLLITLGFGLTGYLLPWDNRAYWGTVVTTEIAGQAPLAGGYIRKLLGATGGVGAVTFAHFYALHTILLPIFAFLLVALHVYLVKRHGVSPAPFENRPKRKFFPEQVFRDTCAIFAVFAVLFFLAALAGAPLEGLADPTNTTYIPRPEWYFLFLFELLKFFRGTAERIGSVLLPTLAVALLFSIPFLDRSRLRPVTQSTFALAAVALSLIVGVSLTVAAVATTPHSTGPDPAEAFSTAPSALVSGARIFAANGCAACHSINGVGGSLAPSLNGVSQRHSRAWIAQHLEDPKSQTPGTIMPQFDLSAQDRDLLLSYLLSLPAK